jgi:exopolysaccharide biosynthesis predicted pyruvyltransferase EpsI
MNLQNKTIAQIRQMPDDLIQEVSDFIDFLVMKHGGNNWELWLQFSESLDIVESDFSDYLANLEDYEERLANGEIKW